MPYKDPEQRRAYQREYRLQNAAKERSYRADWNSRKRKEYQQRYRESNGRHPHTANAIARQRARYDALRQAVFDLLGSVCARCGFSDRRALQIDHINGGGLAEKRLLKGVSTYLKHVVAQGGVGYQILCANCNVIKRIENGEHGSRVPRV